MGNNQLPVKAVLVDNAKADPNQAPIYMALFESDGVTPVDFVAAQAAAQSDSSASTIAGLVSDFNALLAKLRAAGLMHP